MDGRGRVEGVSYALDNVTAGWYQGYDTVDLCWCFMCPVYIPSAISDSNNSEIINVAIIR